MSTTPDPYSSNSQMTGADPGKLPMPTAPMAEDPRKTTTIQPVGYAIGALIVGTVIYMAFFA